MNRGRRNLIIALSVLAGVLVCGIVVAAASAARSSYDAKMAEYQGQADKFSADQKAREEENADLKRQLKNVSAEGQRQADRLAAASEKLAGLRKDLAAALKEVADLDKKYAEIATTEDVATEVAADDVTETEAPAVVQDAGGGGNAVVDQAPAVTVVKVQHAKTNATKNTKKKAKKGGGNRGGSSPGSDSSPGL